MPGPGYKSGVGYVGSKKAREAIAKGRKSGTPASAYFVAPPTVVTKAAPPPPKKVSRTKKIDAIQRKYLRGKRTLPGLDREQTQVAATVLEQGQRQGATRKELKSAVETGLVESNLRNLDYGDADSEGWRQERTSIYGTGKKGPQNVKASARRYFQESADPGEGNRGKGMSAGELAQTVQASAFPDRYDDRKSEAGEILRAYKRGRTPSAKRFVGKLLGSKVRGDKEPGHSKGGDHDPSIPARQAYAQDIGSSGPSKAEREPESGYSQETVSAIVKRLRDRGADVPKNLKLGQDWTGTVNGYRVQLLTAPHGTGPHIHIGARLGEGAISSTGATPSSPGRSGGVGASLAPGGSASGAPGRARARRDLRRKGKSRREALLAEILGTSVYGREPEKVTAKPSSKVTRKQPDLGLS